MTCPHRQLLVPAGFTAQLAGRPADDLASGAPWRLDGDTFLARLPGLLRDRLAAWRLEPDGPLAHGVCAVVVPVRTERGRPAALKVSWPHTEALTEHLALRHWDGDGAVRLLRADPTDFALLLERLSRRDLTSVDDLDACAEIGRLLVRLHAAPGRAHPRIPTVRSQADRWVRELDEALRTGSPALPRRYLEQARHVLARLVTPSPEPEREVVLHTDLHYANVLAAGRDPWLAIDPKPLVGDRAYEVAPVLWNRADELGTGAALRWTARARVEAVCASAGIDEDRARAWCLVRLVLLGLDEPQDASLVVPLVKAMTD